MATDKGRSFTAAENENIRQAIRDLQEARGWGQRGVAEELQVKQQTVSAFMADKYGAGFPMAQRLAEVLGVDLDDLLSGAAAGAPGVSKVQFATRLEHATGKAFRHERHLPRDISAVLKALEGVRGTDDDTLEPYASEWLDASVRLRARDERVDVETLLFDVTAQLIASRAEVASLRADAVTAGMRHGADVKALEDALAKAKAAAEVRASELEEKVLQVKEVAASDRDLLMRIVHMSLNDPFPLISNEQEVADEMNGNQELQREWAQLCDELKAKAQAEAEAALQEKARATSAAQGKPSAPKAFAAPTSKPAAKPAAKAARSDDFPPDDFGGGGDGDDIPF